MTPRIFGLLVVGTVSPFILIGRSLLISLLKVVNSVAVDLGVDS